MAKADRADDELIKAVMEDDEPEVEWASVEDFADAVHINSVETPHPDWMVRIIDIAILAVLAIIGLLLFRGF
jgi:hypothetical protein